MKTILYYCLTLLLCISVCNDAEAKKKKYPNGDVYEGEWKSGQPEGRGKMFYANGDIYEGNWVNGKRHGEGIFVWFESVHKGEDKKFINAFECTYTGNWKNDKISGNGILVRNRHLNSSDSEKKILNGTFEGEELEGEGTIEFANKKYVGKWKNLQPNGYGKMTYANGDVYECKWKNNQPEGRGQITYANGDKYECEWINGKIRLFINPNVNNISEFFGVNYGNGIITGEVKYSYANDNCSYKGNLRDYKRHGEGTFCFAPENCISGTWESDSLVSGSGDLIISGNTVRITKEANRPFKFNIKILANDKVIFIKAVDINKEFPIDQLYNMAFIEVEKVKENLDIPQLLREAEEREKWLKATNFNIKVEKPNTILSHIPLNRLDQIDSLTITGFLYEADVAVINKCKSLRYLDLSRAFITYSPQAKQQQVNEQLGTIAMAQLLGVVADLSDKELSKTEYIMMKAIAKLGNLADEHKDELKQIKQANEDCIIPESAFKNMKFLKTVKLPITAIAIKEGVFSRCVSLEYVELPPYLKSISRYAFANCINLKNLDFPSTITEIEDGAFSGCDSIKKVDLSKNKLSSEDESLYGGNNMEVRLHYNAKSYFCSNKNSTIYFPASLEQIGGKITNCELHFSSPTPPRFRNEIMFGYILQDNKIYVPKGSMTAYFAALGEKNTYIEE